MRGKGGDFVLNLVGGPHVAGDKLQQGTPVMGVDQLDNLLIPGSTLGNRLCNDGSSNLSRDLANAGQDGVKESLRALLNSQGISTGTGSRVDQAVANGIGLGEDASQTKTGEDVHVVALARSADETSVGVGVLGEGSARSKDDLALGVSHGLLERALGLVGGIGQGEDNGALVQAGHGLQDLLREGTRLGRETEQGGGADVFNDGGNVGVLGARVILTGKVQLVLGQAIATVESDKTLGVDQPDHLTGLVLTHAVVVDKVGSQLLGNTDSSGSSSKEENLVILGGNSGKVDGVHESSQDDSASSLNIIVKAKVGGLVLFEELEGVLGREVLELDQQLGVERSQGLNDSINKGEELIVPNTLLAQSEVELVLELVLVVGAEVEGDGDGAAGIDTGTGDVELELSDGDTHAADTEIAQSENAGAVSDDGNLGSELRVLRVGSVVLDDLSEVGEIVDGQEETVGLTGRSEERVNIRVVLASGANGGGVDQGEGFLKLVADESVEETDVGIPEPGEEDVLFNVGGLAPELGEGTLLLGVEGLDLGRAQSMETKGIAKLGGGSSTLVEVRRFSDLLDVDVVGFADSHCVGVCWLLLLLVLVMDVVGERGRRG